MALPANYIASGAGGMAQQPISQQPIQPMAQQPMAQTSPTGLPVNSTTPGGLSGTINNNRYGAGAGQGANQGGAYVSYNQQSGGQAGPSGAYGGQWQSNFGPVDTGIDNFRRYEDAAYNQAMRQLDPQMESQRRAFDQAMVAKGIEPGSTAYNNAFANQSRSHNDMLAQAAFGAQGAGLQAQNQAFGQAMQNNQFGLSQNNQNYQHEFGYDQLANQKDIANIGASASIASSGAAANASMANARLNNQLGMAQLNEQARQYDIGDIFRNQQLDSNTMLGMGNLFNNMQGQSINQFNSQQGANNNWYNQQGAMNANIPGFSFTPTGDLVGNSVNNAGQNMQAAQAEMSMIGDMMGGMMAFSDRRLKDKVVKVGSVGGLNIYEFGYKGTSGRYRGVMAQDLIKTKPEAVKSVNGILMVDYSLLPVNMERVA